MLKWHFLWTEKKTAVFVHLILLYHIVVLKAFHNLSIMHDLYSLSYVKLIIFLFPCFTGESMPEVDGVKVHVELIEGDGELETDIKTENTSSSSCSEIPSLLGKRSCFLEIYKRVKHIIIWVFWLPLTIMNYFLI